MTYTTYHNSYGRRDPMPICEEQPEEVDGRPVQRITPSSGLRRLDCPCCEGKAEHNFGAGEDADGVVCYPCGGWGKVELIDDRPPLIQRHISGDYRLATLNLESPIAASIWTEAGNAARYQRGGSYQAAESHRETVMELLDPLGMDDLSHMALMMLGELEADRKPGEGITLLMRTKVINHAAQKVLSGK